MRILNLVLLFFLISWQSLSAGEYADAFLLASQYPQIQSMGYSTVATRVGSGFAMNNPAGLAANGQGAQISMLYQQFTGLSNNIAVEGKYSLGESYIVGLTLIHSSVDGLYSRPNLSGLSPSDSNSLVALFWKADILVLRLISSSC